MCFQYHVKLLNFRYTSFYGVVAPLLPKIQSYTDTYKRRRVLLLFPIGPESRLQVKFLIALGLSVHIKYKLPQTRDGVISKSPAKILLNYLYSSKKVLCFGYKKLRGRIKDQKAPLLALAQQQQQQLRRKSMYIKRGKEKQNPRPIDVKVLGEKKGLLLLLVGVCF